MTKAKWAWVGLLVAGAACAAAQTAVPVLSSLDAPYPDLQSTTAIKLGGQSWGAAVAYGPVGTPLVLSGTNLGDGGTVWFVSYKNGAVDQAATVPAVVSLWTPTSITFSVPNGAKSGLVKVVTSDQVSNGLPFLVMPGVYSGSCPVSPPPNTLQITTSSLSNGVENQSYNAQLTAAGGSGSYTWSLIGGTLPTGLSLSSSGAISGTPTAPVGPVDINVQVADASSPRQYDGVTLSIQITAQPEGVSSSALYSFSITNTSGGKGFDPVGNIRNYTDSVNGTWSFNYDSLNRVATATGSQGDNPYPDYCWQYDGFGNRLWQTSATAAFASGNGGANSCTVSGGAGPSVWASYTTTNTNRADTTNLGGNTFDPAGNITNDGVNAYLYDGEGRICAVQMAIPGVGTSMMQYLYDADGNRIAKGSISTWSCDTTVNGFTNQSAYVLGPGGGQLSEIGWNPSNGTWQAVHTNIFAAGKLIATYDADPSGQTEGKLYFHLSDWLGSRRQQTDYAGNPVLNFTGLPYGDGPSSIPVSTAAAADATEHHFTGKERDTESGNDYFGSRYYASSMGRWLSPDVVNVTEDRMMNPSSALNKYTYAANNPLKYVDPDGQDIVIFFENGIPGHIMMMAYDPSLPRAAYKSFGPQEPYSRGHWRMVEMPFGVPATNRFGFENLKSADDIRKNFASITIQTSPEVTQQVVQALLAHSHDRTYAVLGGACASSCARILHQIDRFKNIGSNNLQTPYSFFSDVFSVYGNPDTQFPGYDPRDTAIFKPGRNYGSYHPAWDEFDILNLLINQNQQKPTRSCTIYVTPDGNSGDC